MRFSYATGRNGWDPRDERTAVDRLPVFFDTAWQRDSTRTYWSLSLYVASLHAALFMGKEFRVGPARFCTI